MLLARKLVFPLKQTLLMVSWCVICASVRTRSCGNYNITQTCFELNIIIISHKLNISR